jgi:hypothetical protein
MFEAFHRQIIARFGSVPTSPPVVIGATGGSGTRALHAAFGAAGVYMGTHLNHAGDAMHFEQALDGVINPMLEAERIDVAALSERSAWVRRLLGSLRLHAYDKPKTVPHWGWKNPRSMYVLPLIAEIVPEFCFVHLIRDGRDMALSGNQNQLDKHYEALFGKPHGEDRRSAALDLWATANSRAADWAEAALGERYVRIRFEDLCDNPEAEVTRALALFQDKALISDEAIDAAAKLVDKPDSIGRWQRSEEGSGLNVSSTAKAALQRFGYADAQGSAS